MYAIVLLGDVVRSRNVNDREEFQQQLTTALSTVNERYERNLRTDIALLKGVDELGGVVEEIPPVYGIITEIFDRIRPHSIRFAFVRGDIDIGEDQGTVSEMDGPAFHRADELLDRVESEGLWFDMRVGNERLERALADEINLLLRLRHDMTEREFEVVRTYERFEMQARAAQELGVTQQTVSATLSRSSWRMGRTIERRLKENLRWLE